MEASQTAPASHAKEETKMEKQSVRGALCKLAEDVITRRAEDNDASLIEAIISDPHSDFVSVSASYLASLPEIVSFVPALDAGQREKFLVNVLTELSEHLKPNKDKEGKVTIRTEYKRNPRNTLIMHRVPADAKENDLRELFLPISTAASVSFKKDVNSCWLATFDTEANAVATHRALFSQKLTVKGCDISIGLRATRFVRVTPSTTVAPQQAPSGFNGVRGVPPAMRQQAYAFQQQYWMQPMQQQMWMQQYYGPMQPVRAGGHNQGGWMQQPKQRTSRGGGHSRYQNVGYQQQRGGAAEQVALAGGAGAAASTTTATTTTAAPATTAPQQQQPQQQRDGHRQGQGRGGRNYRGRNRGSGANRGHGAQTAASESSSADTAAKDHHPRQPAGSERAEQPAKTQEKPTADSFPPLA